MERKKKMSNNNMDANNLENALSLEKAFDELDELIAQLEKPDNTLETSFQAFEKGMQLVKFCNESIDQVEKKVLVLSQDGELHEF